MLLVGRKLAQLSRRRADSVGCEPEKGYAADLLIVYLGLSPSAALKDAHAQLLMVEMSVISPSRGRSPSPGVGERVSSGLRAAGLGPVPSVPRRELGSHLQRRFRTGFSIKAERSRVQTSCWPVYRITHFMLSSTGSPPRAEKAWKECTPVLVTGSVRSDVTNYTENFLKEEGRSHLLRPVWALRSLQERSGNEAASAGGPAGVGRPTAAPSALLQGLLL